MDMTARLLDAAEFRMRRGGYNAVSLRDLVDDTNNKGSSVHHHCARKEDLRMALIERYLKRFFDSLSKQSENAERLKGGLEAFQQVYRHAAVLVAGHQGYCDKGLWFADAKAATTSPGLIEDAA